MKNNRIITVIITILIVAIILALGALIYLMFLESSKQVSGNNVQDNKVENQLANINTQVENKINNNVQENQILIEPILNEITSNSNTTQEGSLISSYYYSQLDDNAKKLYDGLKSNKEKLTSGNYIIDYGTQFNTLLNSEGGEEELNQAFQSAWNAFSYDNVDLFYIDVTKQTLTNEYYNIGGIKTYKISIGSGENSNYFQNTFKSKQDVEKAQSYLENIRKQMIEQTSADDTYGKIAKVHNWLIYFITYDKDENSKDEHTIYGALKNGKAVCEGYAKAFKYLMDGIGVPCVLVSGTGTNSQGQTESHAWNYVQIDEKWYGVDVTWDDPIVTGGEQTNEMKQRYFLKGSENFFKDHKEDGKVSENSMTFKFPTLSKEDYIK